MATISEPTSETDGGDLKTRPSEEAVLHFGGVLRLRHIVGLCIEDSQAIEVGKRGPLFYLPQQCSLYNSDVFDV